ASPSRGARVVKDTENSRPAMALSAARQIVVLPAPEGAERMKIIPRLGGKESADFKGIEAINRVQTPLYYILFDVLDLLAHLFRFRFYFNRYLRKCCVLRLRTHRIYFAVDFLEQKFNRLADLPLALEQRLEAVEMRAQTRDLFADIAVLRGGRRLLIEAFLVDRQVCQELANALVKIFHYFRARLLGQPFNFRHRRFDIANPHREILVQAAPFAHTLGIQRFQRANQRLVAKPECRARVVLLLNNVKNFRPVEDRSNFRIAVDMKLLAETAQFGNVQIRQPVVHLKPHRRSFQCNRLDKNFDSSARHDILHGFANLGLMLAPSTRHRQLELEKSLVERAHFGNHASAVLLGDSPAEAGHAFHLNRSLSSFSTRVFLTHAR